MMTKKLFSSACIAVLAATCLHVPKVCAQSADSDASIEMVTNNGQDEKKRSRSHDGVMEPVGLALGKGIAITLEVARERAGEPVIVGLLDGGQINATLVTPQGDVALSAYGTDLQENLFVADDGTLRRESLFVADDGEVLRQGLFVADAGTVRPESLFVSEDGTVGFSFQSGSTTGLYRVLVSIGAVQYQLQLYAVKPPAAQ